MPKLNQERQEKILRAALAGGTYQAIASRCGESLATVWNTINRERHNANMRESSARYYARGCVALCDMEQSEKSSGEQLS